MLRGNFIHRSKPPNVHKSSSAPTYANSNETQTLPKPENRYILADASVHCCRRSRLTEAAVCAVHAACKQHFQRRIPRSRRRYPAHLKSSHHRRSHGPALAHEPMRDEAFARSSQTAAAHATPSGHPGCSSSCAACAARKKSSERSHQDRRMTAAVGRASLRRRIRIQHDACSRGAYPARSGIERSYLRSGG
ncbi:hypothetical protein FKP32DRAFT_1203447 [Trametes sanguinea]|nr:hypothetical protein FKP32DRAFT_1203447 [Trametes sanguinea]